MTKMNLSFTPSVDLLGRTRSLLLAAVELGWVESVNVTKDPRHAIVTIASGGHWDTAYGALYPEEVVLIRYDAAARELVLLATPELSGEVRDTLRGDEAGNKGAWACIALDGDGIYIASYKAMIAEALISQVLASDSTVQHSKGL